MELQTELRTNIPVVAILPEEATLVASVMRVTHSIDLSKIRIKVLLESRLFRSMHPSVIGIVESRYREFLALMFTYPELKIVPTKQIDEFWHYHILDTRAYQRDCDIVFGYFLHHYPYFGLNGKNDRDNLEVSFEKTRLLWKSHFKHYPEIETYPSESSSCSGSDCSSCSSYIENA